MENGKCLICGREMKRLTLAHLRTHGVSDWEEYDRIVATRDGDKYGLIESYRLMRLRRLMKMVDCLDEVLAKKAMEPDVSLRDLVAAAGYFSRDLEAYAGALLGASNQETGGWTYVNNVNVLAGIPQDPRERFRVIQQVREALRNESGSVGTDDTG